MRTFTPPCLQIIPSRRRAVGYRSFRLILGLLFLVAAALKLRGLAVSALPPVGWWSLPWVQTAAIEWEIFLGLWLLSGRWLVAAWVVALGTMGLLTGVSAYLGSIGQASCRCFGTISASPWHVFVVDAFVLLLLLSLRPDSEIKALSFSQVCRSVSIAALFVVVVGGALAVLVGLSTWIFWLTGSRIGQAPRGVHDRNPVLRRFWLRQG